jgi:hypothetical protein
LRARVWLEGAVMSEEAFIDIVVPDGGTKIAAEHHTETRRCPISI